MDGVQKINPLRSKSCRSPSISDRIKRTRLVPEYDIYIIGQEDCWPSSLITGFFTPEECRESRTSVVIDRERVSMTVCSSLDLFPLFSHDYLKYGHGFILTHSPTSRKSFEYMQQWYGHLVDHRPSNSQTFGLIMVENHPKPHDCQEEEDALPIEVPEEEGRGLARQLGCEFFKVWPLSTRLEGVFESLEGIGRSTVKNTDVAVKPRDPPRGQVRMVEMTFKLSDGSWKLKPIVPKEKQPTQQCVIA
ncbi:hypothetical protein JAAARDRAFT_58012 [Jaapia argillacea MUCL 33604]|uniref:Uncharacterized protein n=1 Tax=Jaapia argillacea MUCL 33604 TaxID=933084 RepID=A0A067PU71_9AGAM|nr:hypothetical protein JAAARDRAFT_58012 [Jaapia argillacea MUCL 33604]